LPYMMGLGGNVSNKDIILEEGSNSKNSNDKIKVQPNQKNLKVNHARDSKKQ